MVYYAFHQFTIAQWYVQIKKKFAIGSPICWTYPENLQWKAPRKHPDKMPEPPQVAPFNTKEQWLYSRCLKSKPDL